MAMRYHYLLGAVRRRSAPRLLKNGLVIMFVFGAVYLALDVAAPASGFFYARPADSVARELLSRPPASGSSVLYLPQLNVKLPLNASDTADTFNLVIRASRFSLAATPYATSSRSPFYNLDKLQPGDEIFVDTGGQRYAYQVQAPSASPAGPAGNAGAKTPRFGGGQLTLIGEGRTPLGGSGSVTVEALQTGVVAWGEQPIIKPLNP